MNLTNYLYDGKLFVVDAGVLFPDPSKLGVGSIVPEVERYFVEAGGVFAYIITHGHEDHIGALPFLYSQFPAPIYATPWTCSLIRRKFERTNRTLDPKHLNQLEAGDSARLNSIEFKYLRVNHSIPHACSLHIKTNHHSVFHTGDFKCDDTPLMEEIFPEDELKKIGEKGVDLLLSDSTNATKPGRCPSESLVKPALVKILKESKYAVIGTTFSSNLWRIISFIEAAQEAGRKILICGRGLETTLEVAKETGLYTPPSSVFVKDINADNFKRKNLLVLATGCQAEWRAALSRMARGENRSFKIRAGDTVLFSSRMIPGNEKPVINLTNDLLRLGAEIITSREVPNVHVSGHGHQEDLNIYINNLKPKHHVPVHGSVSHQYANISLGYDKNFPVTTHHITNGDVWDLENGALKTIGSVEVGLRFVDNDSQVSMSRETLRERLRIGEHGLAILSGVFSAQKQEFIVNPQIELQGLGMPDNVDEKIWLEKTSHKIKTNYLKLFQQGRKEVSDLNEQSRITLRRELSKLLRKKPIVITKFYTI